MRKSRDAPKVRTSTARAVLNAERDSLIQRFHDEMPGATAERIAAFSGCCRPVVVKWRRAHQDNRS